MVWIESPDDPRLDSLQRKLAELAPNLETIDVGAKSGAELPWPAEQLELCAKAGVFRWFVAKHWGGAEWSPDQIAAAYLKLSAGCLTTTFVITQYTGAARRLGGCDNEELKEELLPSLATGDIFGTVGISHLTTSRRHLGKSILDAVETADGFELNGMAPWVTGGTRADVVITGATLADGRQILAAVPMDLPGIDVPPAAQLVGLTASQTGPIRFEKVKITTDRLLAGPVNDVMKTGVGAGTGGAQTSTLAVGVATAAIEFLEKETEKRPELLPPADALRSDATVLKDQLLRTVAGEHICSNEELRTRANSLALRSSQAALSAAKGTGYVIGHPAGRWCREALFFLVWSCPQPVMTANLCELAGLAGDFGD